MNRYSLVKTNQSISSTFSVLMSVYAGEKPGFLQEALNSIALQTRTDFEIVLVKDGPLSQEMDLLIEEMLGGLKATLVSIVSNQGLAKALDIGLNYCAHELVVRCDSDDINHLRRFEIQIAAMDSFKNVSFLGSQIVEFIEKDSRYRPMPSRIVPNTYDDIVAYSKCRCPMNHPTVCLRKSAVRNIGGYSSVSIRSMEDYALWLVAISAGHVFKNLEQPLVFCRTGVELFGRRRGWKYSIDEFKLFALQLKCRSFSFRLLFCFLSRFVSRLLPQFLFKKVYTNPAIRASQKLPLRETIENGLPKFSARKFLV